ncbi:MAG: hypothetical protein RM338_25545 [Nostoc sp. DedQUE12a]|nr:hypothetical protein [Nostoc sp. DedQUE12a]
MLKYYILEGKNPVAIESFKDWNLWMASASFRDTTVMLNELKDCLISTKFVGINLNPHPSGKPMIFETLVIGGPLDGKRNWYPTWNEAIQGHLKICSQVVKMTKS